MIYNVSLLMYKPLTMTFLRASGILGFVVATLFATCSLPLRDFGGRAEIIVEDFGEVLSLQSGGPNCKSQSDKECYFFQASALAAV